MSKHPYDIGTFIGLRKGFADNHYLLRIYGMDSSEFQTYYHYHLDYFLSKKQGKEKEFLQHVWDIVARRITYYESKDPFSNKHALYVANIRQLKSFQEYLASRDQWNIRPNDLLIREKDERINQLKVRIEQLESRLKELSRYEVA